MKELLKQMKKHLENGEELVLVTVLASSGSTPRGAGAHMLVGQEGRIAGTIGGGAVEHRAEQVARKVLEEKTSLAQDFVLNKNDVQSLGMICGGDVSVFFSYIPPGDKDTLSTIEQAESSFSANEDLWMLCDLKREGRMSLYAPSLGLTDKDLPREIIPQLRRRPQRIQENHRDLYTEQIASAGRVYIFGCGHVGQELEPVLSHLGFRCTVLDDRPEFANRELFPTAEEVRCIDFHHISDSVKIQKEDYVCVMTRGHAFDTIVQAQVLLSRCHRQQDKNSKGTADLDGRIRLLRRGPESRDCPHRPSHPIGNPGRNRNLHRRPNDTGPRRPANPQSYVCRVAAARYFSIYPTTKHAPHEQHGACFAVYIF